MELKIYNTYGSAITEIVEGVTIDDVIIEEDGVTLGYNHNEVYARIVVRMKEEVARELASIGLLEKRYSGEYNPNEDVYQFYPGSVLSHRFEKRIELRGQRNEKGRARKRDEVRRLLAEEVANEKEGVIEYLLEKMNERIRFLSERNNKEERDYVLEVYSGKKMNREYIEEEISSPELESKVTSLNEQIEKLIEERDKEMDRVRLEMNKIMLEKTRKEDFWNDEESDEEGAKKVVLPQNLRDEIILMYAKGGAFQTYKEENLLFHRR